MPSTTLSPSCIAKQLVVSRSRAQELPPNVLGAGATCARLSHLVQSAVIASLFGLCQACTNQPEPEGEVSTLVGVALPFTGESATIGRNLEQAAILALEDVNRALSSGGRKIRLVTTDTNSGSQRGLNAILDLIYGNQVRYLIGPEENNLAADIVPDLKAHDVLSVLPAYASPAIQRVGSRGGAWVRLPPTTLAFGCSMSDATRRAGSGSAKVIATRDDFNQSVGSEFASEFVAAGGSLLATLTVSEQRVVNANAASNVDRMVLIADPKTAATVVTDFAVSGRSPEWLLGPMLRTPGFLWNVPFGALDGARGISPSLTLPDECEETTDKYRGSIICRHDNAQKFSAHYANRWAGDQPFPAAHYYYDAVVLLAMGVNYALARGMPALSANELHALILELSNQSSEEAHWSDLESAFAKLTQGTPVAYLGAAAKYQFDKYGAANHFSFETWRVDGLEYVSEGTYRSWCAR